MSFSWSTFALQAVNFLVLVWLLKRFLFKPVAAIVARRREEITRALSETKAATQSAEQALKDFEARQGEIEAQRLGIIEQTRAVLTDERTKMIEAARADIEKLKSTARMKLDEERETAANELFGQAVKIAVKLAENLLGKFTVPALDELFLDQVLNHLDHLTATERVALLGPVDDDDRRLVLTTAYPMEADAQSKWGSALRERLGTAQRIAFAHDLQLIAGAELKFPHAVIRFNWRDSLAQAQRELNEDEHTS
jgi:F-type H+-transporting ATPase subunit b